MQAAPPPAAPPSRASLRHARKSATPAAACDYVELRTRSAFSFLEGASSPEDLIAAAPDLLEALEELVQRRKSVVEQTGRGTIEGSDNRYTKAVTAIAKARGIA